MIRKKDIEQAEEELRNLKSDSAIDRETAIRWGARYLAAVRLGLSKLLAFQFKHEALEHGALVDKAFFNRLIDQLGAEHDSLLPDAGEEVEGEVQKSGGRSADIFSSAPLLVLEKSEIRSVVHYHGPERAGHRAGMLIGLNDERRPMAMMHYDHFTGPKNIVHVTSLASHSPFAGADLMRHIAHHAASLRAEITGNPIAHGHAPTHTGEGGRMQYYHKLLRRYGPQALASHLRPKKGEDIRRLQPSYVQELVGGKEAPHPVEHVETTGPQFAHVAHVIDQHWAQQGWNLKFDKDKPHEPEPLAKGHGGVNTSGVNTQERAPTAGAGGRAHSREEEEKKRRARDPMIDPEELVNTPWYNDSVRKSLNDPYIMARALKHLPTGRVWQLPEHESHEDGLERITRQHNLDPHANDVEGGYIGHDNQYYNYEEMGDRIENHVKWNGHPRGRQRIQFGDGQKVKIIKSFAVVLAKAAKVIPFPSRHPFEDEAKKYGVKPEEYARVHKFYAGDPEKIENYFRNIKPVWNKSARHKLHYHKMFQGFDISIENRPGTYRHWTHPDGRPGRTMLRNAYGYIKNSTGMDGDHVDVFLGPNEQSPTAYIIHQLKAPDFTTFDEDKVILGADSAAEAQRIYLDHYDDPRFFGGMTAMPLGEFRQKVCATKDEPQMIKSGTPAVVLQI